MRTGPPPDGTGAKVVTATDEKLVCAWHSHWPVYNATLFRFVCHNSYWNAESMMHASRQKLRLVLSPVVRLVLQFLAFSQFRFAPGLIFQSGAFQLVLLPSRLAALLLPVRKLLCGLLLLPQ